jgi:peptidoglycan/xylan/chitin deacetylase (PgdA/CDA1 family)
MRIAVAACTLAIVAILAGSGGYLLHGRTVDDLAPVGQLGTAAPAPAPEPATLPTGRLVPAAAAAHSVAPSETPQPAAEPAATRAVAREPVTTTEPAATQALAQAAPQPAPQILAQAPARASAPASAAPTVRATTSCPGNPNALGVSRVVEVDTLGGPGFGFEHFKTHDFLQPGEVVLTFDDGPWPRNTLAVLAALAANCTKAIFFPIGKHSMWEPGILKQVAAAGHAIGSHTWSHADLSKKSLQEAKDEVEKGISAVRWAAGVPTAPYFRFPALRHPPEVVTYLGQRNIAIFSTDLDSFDFKMRKPDQVRHSVMAKLKKHGKGIILMHDFQHATAEAAADLLKDLKAGGYRVVFMKPKDTVKTIASYDELILKDQKVPTVSTRPTSSVIHTISE